MTAKRGYYSLVQFFPNPSRAEAVNLGVVLFCPDAGYLEAKMASGNRPAAKLVGRAAVDLDELNAAKRAIERRLHVDRDSFQTAEDLQHFAETRANLLRLTPPRPIKVFDPSQEIVRLFDELVGGRPMRHTKTPSFPSLDDLFHRLEQSGRAKLNVDVTVPILGRHLRVPYAYRNGVVNLVKPQLFVESEGRRVVDTAARLAMQGDLLQKHGEDTEGKKKLIVVSSFTPDDNGHAMKNRVAEILNAYSVQNIGEDQLPDFVAHVEQEAH